MKTKNVALKIKTLRELLHKLINQIIQPKHFRGLADLIQLKIGLKNDARPKKRGARPTLVQSGIVSKTTTISDTKQ